MHPMICKSSSVMVGEWYVSPIQAELEAEWEHVACCAEAHCPVEAQPTEPLPFDPDEWRPGQLCYEANNSSTRIKRSVSRLE